MALQFSIDSVLLALLVFAAAAAGRYLGSGKRDCEALCGQIVAHQHEKIAQLEAEIRELRSAAAVRRTEAQAANCIGDDWVIASNEDAEARQGCRTARKITISAADGVTSLVGLQSLESAEAIVINDNLKLKSLTGLEKLVHVQTLEIRRNTRLDSLEPLQALRTAEVVSLESNPKLTTLVGLQNLEMVKTLEICGHEKLESLSQFQRLTSLDLLSVKDNSRLSSLAGLEHLETATDVHVEGNFGLENLTGLERLTRVDTLIVNGNSYMDLQFRKFGLKSLVGLDSLETATTVRIEWNGELVDLTGLEHLTNVVALTVKKNHFSGGWTGLLSLSGLQGLRTVDHLTIEENNALRNLSGLENLVSARILHIVHRWEDCRTLALESLTTVSESLTIVASSTPGVDTLHLPSLRMAKVMRLECSYVKTITGLQGLVELDGLELKGFKKLESLPAFSSLTRVGDLTIQGNEGLHNLSGLEGLQDAEELRIVKNNRLVSIAALGRLEHVLHVVEISDCALLSSLEGLESVRSVESLTLVDLTKLESVAGLRALANAWHGVSIVDSPHLRSLEGLGALSTPRLLVEGGGLEYLGGPFAASGVVVGMVHIDSSSWPSCITAQERAALYSVVRAKELSSIPEVAWRSDKCGESLGTFSCTRGHPCNFSLAGGQSNVTSIFITGRLTGCGPCTRDRPQGSVLENGMVDLGYALNDEEGGLRSVCRCAGWGELGPVAQLLLRGPRPSGTKVCRSGLNCTFELEGEGLEPTDRVVLMGSCSVGNPLLGFAARWTGENAYLLHDPATWYAAPRTRYQVCWRAPCSSAADGSACPAPEDRYFSVGEVELLGVYSRNYSVVLGGNFSVPNIGFGASDGDRMRLRRACGGSTEQGTDVLEASSLGLLFDFGALTESRVGAGSFHLCWCQEHDGLECTAEWQFMAESGDVQILCPPGQGFVARSGRCQECPAGRQKLQPDLEQCSECPVGRSSPGNGKVCEVCQEGTVAESAGSSACFTCWSWQQADETATSCSVNQASLVLLASFYLAVVAFDAMLVQTTRRRLILVDVSIDQKRTIVSTFGSHCFSNFGRASFPVKFHGTGHPGLQKPSEPFRARVRDAVHLELLSWKGKSIERRLDTSMGTLEVPFPHDLYHKGWPVPGAFCLPALFTAVVALSGLVVGAGMTAEGLVGAAVTTLAFTMVVGALRCRPQPTPLTQRVSAFHAELSKRPPTLRDKGPGRALAVGKLHALLDFFREFIRDRTAYYLDTNILQPLTVKAKVSYAELAGAEDVEWFVSHFWGTAFEHFCMALRKHAETVCGERVWTSLRYWVCFCSNNQHMIKDELGEGWAQSSFYLALKSGLCHGTCMVLDDQALPLTRVWCIFELLQTVKLEKDEAIFQGLLLCTSGGVLNAGNGSVDVAMALAQKVGEMDLESAQASNENDARMIRQQVLVEMGSYAAMNGFIRGEVRKMLVRSQASANQQFADVIALLDVV